MTLVLIATWGVAAARPTRSPRVEAAPRAAGEGGSAVGRGGTSGPAGRGGGASGESGERGGAGAGEGGSAGAAGSGAAIAGAAGLGAAGAGVAGSGAAEAGTAGLGGGVPLSGCPSPFAGDPALPPAIEVLAVGTFNVAATPLDDGGSLTILPPPQGGSIVLVGARARNLNPCGVMLTVGLRDTQTQQVRLDARTVNLQTSTAAPYWVETSSQLAGMANVPVCPNQWASTYFFRPRLPAGSDGGRQRPPSGHEDAAGDPGLLDDKNYPMTCSCQCVAGYTLGQACPPTR